MIMFEKKGKGIKSFDYPTPHTDEINEVSKQIESMLQNLKEQSQESIKED